METVNVQDAKTRLSSLLARVERGETITIARSGTPIATLSPLGAPVGRKFGPIAFEVPDDFDAPLDGEELAAWE